MLTIEQDAVFTFTYETTNPQVIEKYGGAGNRLQNVGGIVSQGTVWYFK